MDFKGTKGKWIVKKSETKDTFNVVGTALGDKYKIARCPYFVDKRLSSELNKREELETKANALLISKAPELLEQLKSMYELCEEIAMKIHADDYNEQFRDKFNPIMTNTEFLIKQATKL